MDGPAGWPAVPADPAAPGDTAGAGPVRVVLGLGEAERERHALATLTEGHGFAIVGRCLSADDLLPRLDGQGVDAALLAADLHHLGPAVIRDIQRRVRRVVVLVPDRRSEAAWRELGVAVLAADAPPSAVAAVLRGAEPAPVAPVQPEVAPPPAPVRDTPAVAGSLLAITGGGGSPGRTMVATNLAVGLASVAPTVLVDADLSAPMIAAYLGADTTQNLYLVAYAAPRSPAEWDRALSQELQPLSARAPQGAVLCGVPKPDMGGRISAAFFAELLRELCQRYRYVVVDAGGELGGDSGEVGRLVVERAGQVLLVATPDLVGLAHAQRALEQLGFQDGAGEERVAVVINRYARKHHPSRKTLEFTLGAPLAAIVPYDYDGAEQALHDQRPLVLDRHSPASRAVLACAGRLHGGAVRLPPEKPRRSAATRLKGVARTAGGLRRLLDATSVVRRLAAWRGRRVTAPPAPAPTTEEEASDGRLARAG